MIGIVLAGGLATRLPNKPLLPLRSGKPVITSSLDLFARSEIDETIIVVPPNSIIPLLLGTNYDDMSLQYAVQIEATGVPHAMTHAVMGRDKDETYVMSCCDNVYHREEKIDRRNIKIANPCACVRYEAPCKAVYLAKCNINDRRWFNAPHDFHNPCVAGWMAFKQEHIMRAESGMSTVDFLTEIGAEPLIASENNEWWDVGTSETYAAYWRYGRV